MGLTALYNAIATPTNLRVGIQLRWTNVYFGPQMAMSDFFAVDTENTILTYMDS